VVWPEQNYLLLHVRVDGGFITDNNVKKNDCLIFCSKSLTDQFTSVVLIEVKSKSYTIDEVVEQLQRGRDEFNEAIRDLDQSFERPIIIKPMLPLGQRTNSIAALAAHSLTNVRRNRYEVVPILCAKKKIELLKRVAYNARFKIRMGNKSERIRFVKSGSSFVSVLDT